SQLPYGALRRHIDPDVRNDHRNYRAALRVACLSGRSASSCDAERRELHSPLERRERSSQLPYGALRRHIDPDVRNDHRNYRATLRVENCITTLERAER
ncbi:hypothetical protein ABNM51_17420, partial [Pseudomonas syringae]